MWPSPDVVKILLAALALLLELFVDFSCLSGLVQYLARWGRPGHVLVRYAGHLMSWPLDATIISGLQVGCVALSIGVRAYGGHATRCRVKTPKWLQGVDCGAEIVLVVPGVGSWVRKGHGTGVVRLGCSSLPCLCSSRSLLACSVFFGEALLTGFALPVVVAHSSPVDDEPASKLPEHGSRGNNRNLPRAVRVWQYLLVDEVVFLGLRSDDLEQGPVLVEKQVRVAIAEDARTLSCKHKQLVASVGHKEGPATVLAPFEWVACLRDLSLACLVNFAGNVLVAFRVQLVGGVVAHRGQRLYHCGFCGGGFGGWGGSWRRPLGQRGGLELGCLYGRRDAAVRGRGRLGGPLGTASIRAFCCLWRAPALSRFPFVCACVSVVSSPSARSRDP